MTVTPAGSDDGAASLAPASWTFTADNWNMARIFTVSGAADGDSRQAARLAVTEIRRALPLLAPTSQDGPLPVLTISAATGSGVGKLWDRIVEHRRLLDASGGPARRRARGRLAWMQVLLERGLLEQFESQPGLADRRTDLEQAVEQGEVTPESAVDELVSSAVCRPFLE